ncbi:hypothetical protein HPB50_005727 [Hyalomma asiaticum]|uniref:Uncharacterized protein n=1 Tax=Hyalomma asiaticum TaxID=266040 RepID=A0ACB7RSP0_HYAAI|nr:hypothetical protein HPB50_005727 [Hyalomma asiaticum]
MRVPNAESRGGGRKRHGAPWSYDAAASADFARKPSVAVTMAQCECSAVGDWGDGQKMWNFVASLLGSDTVVSRATATERAVAAVLVSAELCISIIGNLLVLFVSLWDEHVKQHRSNLLVISLAVTDLLTATLVMVSRRKLVTVNGMWHDLSHMLLDPA